MLVLMLMLIVGIGHLLVTTRNHNQKVADLGAEESREIGTYKSPISE
jgi:hypothetical protein